MIGIQFEWNSDDLQPFSPDGKGAIYQATANALRMAGAGAIRAVRADAKRRIRSRKRIRAEYLSTRALPLSYPHRRQEINAMVWKMGAWGKEVPLGKYPSRQTRRGVSIMVNRGQRKLIRGAFIARMKSGHVGVFMREGKSRLPIKHALSSRTSDVIQDKGMPEAVLERGVSVFERDFRRLLPLEIEKAKNRASTKSG